MASGDRIEVFEAAAGMPPTVSFAVPVRRNSHFVYAFDAAADENLDFESVWPVTFPAGGVTLRLHWAADTATSGACRWQVSFERIATAQDLDADGFATAKSAGTTTGGTAGVPNLTSITFTQAEADALDLGEAYRLRISRDADGTTGTDDMTGDAHLLAVEVYET